MKRNRESQYRIKMIQEMHLNKKDQIILEEAIHNAKITFFKIYGIGVHKITNAKQLVEFIKRYGELRQSWIQSPYIPSATFYLGKHWINKTEQFYGVVPGFCI